MKFRLIVCLLPIALVCLGCGDGVESGSVSGLVTLDGQPLDRARVTFSHSSGKFFYGETDAEGRYELQSTGADSSIPLGAHSVAITTAFTGRNDAGEMVDFPQRVPPRYNDRSELREEVAAGAQEIDFALTTE